MKRILKIKEVIIDPVLFTKVMLLLMLLINFPYIGSVVKMIMKVLPIWGGIVFCFNLKYFREILKEKFYKYLILMVFTYGVTILINFRFNLIQNIKSWVWYIIYIGILLIWWRVGDRSKQEICENIKQINWFVIIINLINVFSCMIFWVENIGIVFQNRAVGICDKRLFGIVDGVNPSMMIALVSVLAAALNREIDEKPSKLKNIVYIVNMVCTYISIIASGTRSVRYVMIVVIAFYMVVVVWKKWDADKYLADIKKAIVISALWGIIFFLGTAIMVEATRYPIGLVPVISQSLKERIITDEISNEISNEISDDNNIKNRLIIRGKAGEEAALNARIFIWKECIAIWKEHPFFGVGNANYTESTHSMPVALLVYSGGIGTIIFMGYLILRMIDAFTVLLKKCKNMNSLWFSMVFPFMICVALCLYSLTDALIIFNNAENTMLFWVYLGIMGVSEHWLEDNVGADNKK